MFHPIITIIVPVFNAKKYLSRCLDSIIAQTFADWECILVDDGSSDGSGYICDEYASLDSRFRVIHKANEGVSCARNAGLKIANGDFIGFVDSDDYISPVMYESLYKGVSKHNVDVVFCNYYIVGSDKHIKANSFVDCDVIIEGEKKINYINCCQTNKLLWFVWKGLYRKSILLNANITFVEEDVIEDSLFNLEYLLNCSNFIYLSSALYYYFLSEDSITRINYKESYLNTLENTYNYKTKIFKKYNFIGYKIDSHRYTLSHTLPLLISNQLSSSESLWQIYNEFCKIINSNMIKEACSSEVKVIYTGNIRYLIYLLKHKHAFILAIISKLYKWL